VDVCHRWRRLRTSMLPRVPRKVSVIDASAGEWNTSERLVQADRIIRTHYWHLGAGVAYSFSSLGVFAAYTKYIWGRDTHNGQTYIVGSTWYFDLSN
jgi:hypothetical protein